MNRPIFCLATPRGCSTAFERVFMTRTKDLVCFHEPFGDAFYYGPERLGPRFENDEQARIESGCENSTYKTILDRIEDENVKSKRVFIKDMGYYLSPPNDKPAQIAPSLDAKRRGVGTTNGTYSNGTSAGPPFPYGTEAEEGNPTVIPGVLLRKFHFTFLIRDPHSSISSFYRYTVPPLDKTTGGYKFDPSEAGYKEIRRILEFFVSSGQIGPKIAGQKNETANGYVANGTKDADEICLIDADDLLDNPEGILQEYCRSVGLKYDPKMLRWDDEEDQERARVAFEKWNGWHDDALNSKDLKPRTHGKAQKTEEQWDAEWKEKYGEKGQKIIRQTVDDNMADYLYLKKYAMKV